MGCFVFGVALHHLLGSQNGIAKVAQLKVALGKPQPWALVCGKCGDGFAVYLARGFFPSGHFHGRASAVEVVNHRVNRFCWGGCRRITCVRVWWGSAIRRGCFRWGACCRSSSVPTGDIFGKLIVCGRGCTPSQCDADSESQCECVSNHHCNRKPLKTKNVDKSMNVRFFMTNQLVSIKSTQPFLYRAA